MKAGSALAPEAGTMDEILAQQKSLNASISEMRHARENPGRQPGNTILRGMSATQGDPRQRELHNAGRSIWNTPGQFLRAVRDCAVGVESTSGLQSREKMKSWVGAVTKALPSGMNETVGGDGGYLVPPEFSNQLLMRTYANDLLSRTTLFPMGSSNMLKIPAVNEASRANGSRFGGVRAYWRSEAGELTASKPNFDLVSLEPDSLTLLVRATQELLDDSTSLEGWLNIVADQELSFVVGDAIVNGDGVTKPLGLMNSPSIISVAKETGQPAATILAENILAMWARLHVSCRPNAVWLVDQSLEAKLPLMTIGTAGAQLAAYLPPGGLNDSPYGKLLGKDVIVTEFNQTLGTTGDIILTDLATYLTATRGGLQSAVSMHVYYTTNEQAFRWVMRIAGRSWWLSALTPKSAGATQSNIVKLDTRS